MAFNQIWSKLWSFRVKFKKPRPFEFLAAFNSWNSPTKSHLLSNLAKIMIYYIYGVLPIWTLNCDNSFQILPKIPKILSTVPLLICTWYLKNHVRQTGFLACKNQFRNWFLHASQAVKIKFEIDILSNLIF